MMQLYDKRQAHYYWFIVAFICVSYARDGLYTYKGVETTSVLGEGEGNATKVYNLALEKMKSLEAALESDSDELTAAYRDYFFTYREPQEVMAVGAADQGGA